MWAQENLKSPGARLDVKVCRRKAPKLCDFKTVSGTMF